jgi:hypothetical protein
MVKSKTIFFIIFISACIVSCTDDSIQIHIDESKKAIVSCNGNLIQEVEIDGLILM